MSTAFLVNDFNYGLKVVNLVTGNVYFRLFNVTEQGIFGYFSNIFNSNPIEGQASRRQKYSLMFSQLVIQNSDQVFHEIAGSEKNMG
jgi:hypothetical protein